MAENPTQKVVRVGLVSLGCAKNLVDAEIMLGALLKDGVEITNDPARAEVVIVNTCSFIDAAQEESVDTILEFAAVREANRRGQGLIVAGCLPQRFGAELPRLLPEVDAFLGIDQVTQIPQIVRRVVERRRQRLTGQIRKPEIQAGTSKAPAHRGDLNGERARAAMAQDRDTDQPRQALPTLLTPAGTDRPSRPALDALGSDPPLVEVHARPTYIPDFATPRFRLTARHFAYVKIAEGCNHPCSFCTIPRMRGAHRSRPLADIVAEAQALLAEGVKELNLISQDTTYYGLDLRPRLDGRLARPENFRAAARALPVGTPTLCTLLRELNALPGNFWIRLLYTHPAHWTDELIETIAACPKVARYVDLPLQHIHDNLLQRMRRETSRQYLVELIARLRARLPGLAIRTTFIVGFPGETEACFQALLAFIRETRFERLGVFTYSQEQGTVAGKMAGQVPARLKRERRDRAMAEQRRVAREIAGSFVGRTLTVLVESEATVQELKQAKVLSWEHGLIRLRDERTGQLRGRYLVARGEADAPDIDGRVYIRGQLPLGQFASVKIIGHTDYDLIAEPA